VKKALLIAVSLVLAVVVGVVGWVYADSTASIRRTYALNTVVPPIPGDSAPCSPRSASSFPSQRTGCSTKNRSRAARHHQRQPVV
jgi:hypothetical protein